MRSAHWLMGLLATAGLSCLADAQGVWTDKFETYALGSNIVGQGGWTEWNNGAAKNETISNNVSFSAPHSLSVDGDPIHQFTGYTSGRWVFKAKIYCPSTTAGQYDFQLFSQYIVGGGKAWAGLMQFNFPTQGSLRVWDGSGGTTTGTALLDQWADLRITIDLDADTIEILYGPNPPVQYPYTGGYYGGSTYPKDIAAISLLTQFPAGSGEVVYWDNLSIGPDVPDPTFFCTAKSGLACGTPQIDYTGVSSATLQSGFSVTASPARTCKSGILLYNQAQAGTNLPFEGGTLCVESMGLRRAGSTNSGGTPGGANCDGAFSLDINTFSKGTWQVPDCAGNPSGIAPNNSAAFLNGVANQIFAQWWGRDSVATGSYVSDGISWIVGP